jgi:hypothetical protein
VAREPGRAVVITSTPRSGSTWISRVLTDHPGLQVYSHDRDDMWLLYLLYPLRSASPLHEDAIQTDGLVDRLLGAPRAELVRRFYAGPRDQRLRVFSSPTNAAFLPLFRRVFADAKFVHLRRNPLDVIASFHDFQANNVTANFMRRYRRRRERGWLPAVQAGFAHYFHRLRWLASGQPGYVHFRPPGFFEGRSLVGLEYLTWYYCLLVHWIDSMLSGLPPNHLHHLSYDGMVNDTRRELEAFLGFIGAGLDEAHLQSTIEGIERRKRKRDHFRPDEVAAIEGWLKKYSAGDGCGP